MLLRIGENKRMEIEIPQRDSHPFWPSSVRVCEMPMVTFFPRLVINFSKLKWLKWTLPHVLFTLIYHVDVCVVIFYRIMKPIINSSRMAIFLSLELRPRLRHCSSTLQANDWFHWIHAVFGVYSGGIFFLCPEAKVWEQNTMMFGVRTQIQAFWLRIFFNKYEMRIHSRNQYRCKVGSLFAENSWLNKSTRVFEINERK